MAQTRGPAQAQDPAQAVQLTQAQEEALVLIWMQELDAIVPALHGAIAELVALGLAAGPAGAWTVTDAGRARAQALTDD